MLGNVGLAGAHDTADLPDGELALPQGVDYAKASRAGERLTDIGVKLVQVGHR